MSIGGNKKFGPEVLLVRHIYGPLFMLFIGIAIATFTFIGEHIYHRITQIAKNKIIIVLKRK